VAPILTTNTSLVTTVQPATTPQTNNGITAGFAGFTSVAAGGANGTAASTAGFMPLQAADALAINCVASSGSVPSIPPLSIQLFVV